MSPRQRTQPQPQPQPAEHHRMTPMERMHDLARASMERRSTQGEAFEIKENSKGDPYLGSLVIVRLPDENGWKPYLDRGLEMYAHVREALEPFRAYNGGER